MRRTRAGPQREDALWSRRCPWCWSPPQPSSYKASVSGWASCGLDHGLDVRWVRRGEDPLTGTGWLEIRGFPGGARPLPETPAFHGNLSWRLQTPFQSLTQGPTFGDHLPALQSARILQTAAVWHNPCCPQRLYPQPRTTNLTDGAGWTCGDQEPRKTPPPLEETGGGPGRGRGPGQRPGGKGLTFGPSHGPSLRSLHMPRSCPSRLLHALGLTCGRIPSAAPALASTAGSLSALCPPLPGRGGTPTPLGTPRLAPPSQLRLQAGLYGLLGEGS